MEGQSLEVSSNRVAGVLGKSVVMTWTVRTSQDFTATLYIPKKPFGRTTLFNLRKSQVSKNNDAKTSFDGRITAAWVASTFKLEIKHLQRNDNQTIFSFLLYMKDSSGKKIRVGKPITLTVVKGMS